MIEYGIISTVVSWVIYVIAYAVLICGVISVLLGVIMLVEYLVKKILMHYQSWEILIEFVKNRKAIKDHINRKKSKT